MRMLLSILLIAMFPLVGTAADFPKLIGRVVDDANILNDSTEKSLSEILKKHEAQTTNQVVVVTVNSLQGLTEEDYAKKIGNIWGIGQKGKNNGVIILTAIQERKIRIQVGSGLTRVLTNDMAKEVIDNHISPYFKQNDFNSGIISGIQEIITILKKNENVSLYDYVTSGLREVLDIISLIVILPAIFLLKFFGLRLFGIETDSFTGGGGSFGGGGGASGDF